MFSLLEVAPTTNDDLNDIPQSNDAEIRFENISFDYDIRRTIIKNISFTVPNGKKVAIVGPTGAGKSTISRLLFKFYDPKEGNIFINNTNVNKISQNSLRKIIGVVPQDTVLFNDTIYYNIAYGNTGATKEEVISAAQNADIHDFITILPDGYETIVGEQAEVGLVPRGVRRNSGEPSNQGRGKRELFGNRVVLVLVNGDSDTSRLPRRVRLGGDLQGFHPEPRRTKPSHRRGRNRAS